jgi:hypothetical protein
LGVAIRARLAQILDLFVEDSWRNVYAGELELRPPDAPTTNCFGSRRINLRGFLGNFKIETI